MTADASSNNVAWYGLYGGTPVAYGMKIVVVNPTSITVAPTACEDTSSHLLSTIATLAGLIPIPGTLTSIAWSLGTTILGSPEAPNVECKPLGSTMTIPLRFANGHTFAAPTTTRTTIDVGNYFPSGNLPGANCYNHEQCRELHTFTFTIQADTNIPNQTETSSGPYPQSTFQPIASTRLIDSRIAGTLCSGKILTVVAHTCQVTGAVVPAGAVAVTGNLTVTGQSAAGYLYLGPVPMDYPSTSTLNFPVSDNRANNVTVPLDSGGRFSVTYVGPYAQVAFGSSAYFIFDVTGYFVAGAGGYLYNPTTPTRLLDTRNGTGLSGAFQANVPRSFVVTGSPVPYYAWAVTGNLTVTQASAAGYLTISSTDQVRPSTSTLNFPAQEDRANGVTAYLPGSTLSVTYVAAAGATAHVIFDVTGYYASSSGYSYVPMVPARLLDTRYGTGLSNPFYAYTARTIPITGRSNIPSTASAVTGNLTITGQTAAGWFYLGPDTNSHPGSSTMNFPVSDTRANGVTVGLGSGGTLGGTYGASSGARVSVILDITGYFR